MKLLMITLPVFVAASLASAQTFDPTLPDATLIGYSGDQSIYAVWSLPIDIHRQSSVYNTADCAYQGTQGNPPTYAGYGIGGRIAFTCGNSPSCKVPACYPIDVELNASWFSRRPYGTPQVNDHLYQALYVTAVGSLPGGIPGDNTQNEACSLIGNNGGIGSPHTSVFQEGACVYYGNPYGMQ